MKSFKIDWQGMEEVVEFDENLTFGEMEQVVNSCVTLMPKGMPKIDMQNYRVSILVKVIKKAPFKVGDVGEINNLPRKVARKITQEIMAEYPLEDCLLDWMETVTGRTITKEEAELQIQST